VDVLGQGNSDYYTVKELAEKLGVHPNTIMKWRYKNAIPYIKTGRLIRFPKVEIEKRLLNGQFLMVA
jgi:excisionase family DNA binding protein